MKRLMFLLALGAAHSAELSREVIAVPGGEAWKRHTIDNSSRGADGVKLGDVNRDGLPDIVSGWEEGGVVRVYVRDQLGVISYENSWR